MKVISNQAAKWASDICRAYLADTAENKTDKARNNRRKAALLLKKLEKK